MTRYGLMFGRGLAVALLALLLGCLGGRGALAHEAGHHGARAVAVETVAHVSADVCVRACETPARLPCCTDEICLLGFAGLPAPAAGLGIGPRLDAERLRPLPVLLPGGVRPAIPSPPPRAIG